MSLLLITFAKLLISVRFTTSCFKNNIEEMLLNSFNVIGLLILFYLYPISVYAQVYQTGDIIFQTSKSAQSQVIQQATHSPYSHMGMIVVRNGQTWVLEAIQPVQYTPLQQWINRGVNQSYSVKRYQTQLSVAQQQKLVRHAETYLKKPYDVYFEWSDDAIYCSELVWKTYKKALAIELAPLDKLSSFDLHHPSVKALMKQRYGQHIPLNEMVIAPSTLFNSKQLIDVR
ncbi:YiiX family permuted papain-like enzyme [Acinetobacter sp.]|uniref:YiiX family permuted papain-like enzyme n=1 Tax=Acinetobacter sp. TaxID=472 RepID=UPI00281B7BCF|nr:YiiX family permuted papain-like enzyme [Acinetobacter sp.]MDR0235439.1 YiiX family permuted papain-like enzyme [Acinetobacter sp.]